MEYTKPGLVASYFVADLYGGASGFSSAAPACGDDNGYDFDCAPS